ncbi:xin actin-binding repeat-containing protein 2 isoform X1 [Girardinichthys multiradiatus]|uniref:xin actin-binding repeat-containing protein 2 isoform X1 n=2 Tax=Girardinichthys multiradiatus TaxID=208333 RepID=UPI001FAD52E9|nr:xin actin-binding repeat-containing protein 2 isoform X1 [Girardinichthys multiradiatus]
MEIQSGNGEEVASATSVFISCGSSRLQVVTSDEPVLREDLQAAKRVEKFDIQLDSLKRMFEKPAATRTEVAATPPAKTVTSSSSTQAVESTHQSMASPQDATHPASNSGSGGSKESAENQEAEPVSVKERLAMYQAAVSNKESSNSSSAAVMDESEACSLPGGLATVKRQFEGHEFTSSSSQSTVTQFHVQKRSVQEMSSSSEVTVKSSVREMIPPTSLSQQEVIHDQGAHHNNVAAGYGNHYNETVMLVGGEDLPKVSTQALKQQYEKTIEDAAPATETKVDVDFNQFQWAPVNQSSNTSTVTSYDSSSTVKTSSVVASTSSVAYEATEQFPPPPANLMQVTQEHSVSSQSQEKGSQTKFTLDKKQYFKHKSMAELKRLYKHIHPEVRKNLEEDFMSQLTEAEKAELESKETVGDVQQTCYMFENDSVSSSECSSPDREYLEWEEILKGEVQSMRWMFENKPLDTIKDDSPDESEGRNIAQQEIIAGKDVRYTAWMFETQPMDALGTETADATQESQKQTDLARGDVRTATWLFETQPLDCLNKIYQEEQENEFVVTKDITGGDVKTARYLFETQHLDYLGKMETIEESHFLHLKSELEEIKGDVKTTTRMFETQPMCVIRGDSGEMLEITTIRREETEKGDVTTSRWMFETQPLDMINKDPAKVKLICGISMEDNIQSGVNKGRWLFETKTLDTIKDEELETSRNQKEQIIGADVKRHCLVFETQPMDTLKDNANARPLTQEEIVGGNVRSTKHRFETVPMENLKELHEVGTLKKIIASEEEKGDVRHQKWVFESQPLENIREEKKEITRTVNIEALDKGDVTNYKERFETLDLSKCEGTQKIHVEGVTSGSVKSNRVLFESTPMYAMQDSFGHYHEVKTVRREEIVKGDVCSCRWMFETRPIDDFDESINKFQIIKGISKQEIESGDVKTAKWLFETQPLDAIKCFSNFEEEEHKTKKDIKIEKGDVKTCRWLFETQPMDVLYEKVEKNEAGVEEVQKGDVKTCTWLFETQTLDNIRDHSESETETILKTCTVKQEDIQGKDVEMARFLFETENLENITGEDISSFKRVTEINIQSGDVSRMKYIFENHSSDIMSSTSEEMMLKLKREQAEDIQRGNVVNCTWMFENQPIDAICDDSTKVREIRTITDVQGGDVDKGRIIFETYSLDQIKDESTETNISKLTNIFGDDIVKGDVKNYTMMFETQPLYAIRDKEGHYHEVTTVTKEEIMRGDVVGARWLFETKPLDSIRDSEEVYVIKAVTEEGINKGDVSSARWKFETQPLDEITEEIKVRSKTVADIQGGDVKTNKQRFETDEMCQKYIRTVSVSEIQKGDVRSATWMFETRTIDDIRRDTEEYDAMERVTKKEVMKGDVKQSVWLFERHPLDRIKETDGTEPTVIKEEIPQADVKTTTWLFETTPFHEFNESSVEKTEIIGKSIKETLEELYCQKILNSQGILIEADEIGDVRMAKYKLLNQEVPQIQKEEVIRGDLSNIMMNLLNRTETTERVITIDKEERGDINTTVKQLFNQGKGASVQKEVVVRGDIQEAINNLLKNEGSSKRGILIQEDEKGDIKMTIYSLLNKEKQSSLEKEDIIQGNVSKTLHRLLSNSGEEDSKRIKIEDTERGNVSFYTTCIESGALDYLKQLKSESDEVYEEVQKERIIGGDIEEAKLLLRKNQQQIGRTVAEDDIVPGDVHSIVKVFMTEPTVSYKNLEEKNIVKGDLTAALDLLSQAINQKVVVEKEEVVKGDIPNTLKSLEEAKSQAKDMEKPEIIKGDIRGALESLEKSATSKTEVTVDDLVPGNIKGTLKCLEEAKQAVKEMEKEEIIKGDIYTAMQNLHEASSEKKTYQHQVSEQGDVRATIQLLLEPTTSPKMQRRGSVEGDVKTSIKSLYEDQETTHMEKEEVVKGDVQGAIKSLMQRKQYSNKKRMHPPKKAKMPMKNPSSVKQVEHEGSHEVMSENVALTTTPTVKNLSQSRESQMNTQRHHESKLLKTQVITQEDHSVAVVKTDNPAGASHQKSIKEQKDKVLPPHKMQAPKPIMIKNTQKTINDQTENKAADVTVMNEVQNTTQMNISNKQMCETKTIKQVQTTVTEKTVRHKQNVMVSEEISQKQMENKAVGQKQNFKNLKSNHRNLDMKGKGVIKKTKPEIHFPPPPTSPPPPSESEHSLPPPPSPVTESPASPSCQPHIMRQDSDLPPPPPPPPPHIECMKSESDFFPPPPPPPAPSSVGGPDFLPPPPSQQELNEMPQLPPAKQGKSIGVTSFKVPKKPEPQKQPAQLKPKWQKKQPTPPPPLPHLPPGQETAVPTVHKEEVKVQDVKQEAIQQTEARSQSKAAAMSSTRISSIPYVQQEQKHSPQPPKKVFVPPIKLPPPPDSAPAPKDRPYPRKFKTPLMLAEERYRQQKQEKEEEEKINVLTPTSPQMNIQSSATSAELYAAESAKREVALEVTKAKNEEQIKAQDSPAKETPSQIPLSKASVSVKNKNSALASSNVSLDKKQVSSTEATKKALTSTDTSVSQSHHEASEKEIHTCLNVAAVSVTEQQQFIKKSSTRSNTATQSAVWDNVNLQSPAAVTLKTEDVKNINVPLTQEGKMSPSQPTKIPKVAPSFKMKTFKMPSEKTGAKSDSLGQKEIMKSETHLKREKSQMSQRVESKVHLESNQLTSTRTELNTEVKENKNQVPPPVKGVDVNTHTKKGKQVTKNETEVKLSPSVTVSVPVVAMVTSVPTHQGQSLVSVSHSQQSMKTEHIQRHKEVVVTDRMVQQDIQKQEAVCTQQQTKLLVTETTKMQVKAGKSNDVSKEVLAKGISKVSHKDEAQLKEITDSEKCSVIQKLFAKIKELESAPSKVDSNSVRAAIDEVPEWVMGLDEKKNFSELAKQQSKKKLKEMMAYVKHIIQTKLIVLEKNLTAIEKEVKEEKEEPPVPVPVPSPVPPPVPPKPDMKVLSGATAKMLKAGSGSFKTQKKVVEEKKSVQESRVHQDLSEVTGQRISSPLASIRTPSPTFITIESRRVDSPLRVTPSPPPYKSVGTPPPPPRRTYTPTSTFSRATPSPTLSRSEKLMKLRDTTSKLSRGMTPPPPMPVPEYFAGERERTSSFSDMETGADRSDYGLVDVTEMGDSMMTVKDKKSFFEEAQKADVNKMYTRKDPIDIPERLGPDAEDTTEIVTTDLMKEDLPRVDLSKLVNRFESHQPKMYTRKDPIVISERLESDIEDTEAEAHTPRTEEIPTFNVKAIKDVFETGEHGSQAARELREQIERREPEPGGHTETTSVTEQFCTVDDFGNMTRETISEMHSGSLLTRGNPPSYADVVRGTVPTVSVPPEASAEKMLKNLQQSWAESQGVFQNLGFSVTEQRTSQTITHQQETFMTENSNSRVRAVQGVSEEGIPHGIPDCRPTKLP